ncbi:MAG: hypothetical protein Q4C30_08805, partial [Bacteroidia bacterium]|nr:hypothetical protein [Bacteroidia bacterium]
NKIGSIAELANMTAEEISKYHVNIDTVRTARCVMRYEREEGRAEGIEIGMQRGIAKGREEGRAEGREEGRAEGERHQQIQIAKNLKGLNMSISQIVLATGLSEEEINKL